MANADPQLQEAYELIEAGDLDSARQLLEEIRSNNENNPDFWWIYSHAVEDKDDGLAALDRVRQLAPNYPGLQNLSEQLGISSPQPPQRMSPPVPTPSTESIESFYNNEIHDELDETEASTSGLPFYLIAGIAVITIIAALFLISNLFSGNDGDETPTEVAIVEDSSPEPVIPTSVAESATDDMDEPTEVETEEIVEATATEAEEEPTEVETEEIVQATETEVEEEPTATETEEATEEPTVEPTDIPTETSIPEDSDPFAEIYPDLEEFGVPEDGIVVETTETFGDTYVVTTCSAIGPIATQNILDIVATLQPISDNLDEDIEGIAFNITDCDSNDVNLTLGFDRETVDSYWNDEIPQVELQQALRRVN